MKKTKKAPITREQIVRTLKFAQDNHCVIHATGYEYYLEGFSMFQHCPCDAKRLACPCEQAVQEVQEKGHCLCQLFWRDYATYAAEKLKE